MLYSLMLLVPDISCPIISNTSSGAVDIYVRKIDSWNVNCTRATAFVFYNKNIGDQQNSFKQSLFNYIVQFIISRYTL